MLMEPKTHSSDFIRKYFHFQRYCIEIITSNSLVSTFGGSSTNQIASYSKTIHCRGDGEDINFKVDDSRQL